MLLDLESESRSALPQYLVYSELRNIHPNYALWIVTTLLWTIKLLQNSGHECVKLSKMEMNHKNIRNELVWLKVLR